MEEVIFGIDIQSSDAEKNLASLTAKIAGNRKLLREQKKALDDFFYMLNILMFLFSKFLRSFCVFVCKKICC